MDIDLQAIVRMVAAVLAGAAIGFNRDIHGKPTGIRAHSLVSLGAAILVIASTLYDEAEYLRDYEVFKREAMERS